MAEDKSAYVVIEPQDGAPRVLGKYDVYVSPWTAYTDVVDDYMSSVENGVPVTLRLTVHEWTEAEYAAFCEEHEIDLDD